jgi:hypothetical protein
LNDGEATAPRTTRAGLVLTSSAAWPVFLFVSHLAPLVGNLLQPCLCLRIATGGSKSLALAHFVSVYLCSGHAQIMCATSDSRHRQSSEINLDCEGIAAGGAVQRIHPDASAIG